MEQSLQKQQAFRPDLSVADSRDHLVAKRKPTAVASDVETETCRLRRSHMSRAHLYLHVTWKQTRSCVFTLPGRNSGSIRDYLIEVFLHTLASVPHSRLQMH